MAPAQVFVSKALQKQSRKGHRVPELVAGAPGHKGLWEVGIMSGSKDEESWLKNWLKNEVGDLGETKLPVSCLWCIQKAQSLLNENIAWKNSPNLYNLYFHPTNALKQGIEWLLQLKRR